jgi:hypothetical protein
LVVIPQEPEKPEYMRKLWLFSWSMVRMDMIGWRILKGEGLFFFLKLRKI